MPVTERRQRRRLALRETIVEAARTIVRDEGLHVLTMRRIADAIDYAPASLYAHFASREALLAELCREGTMALGAALAAAAGDPDPRTRLHALATAYVGFALDHPDTYRLIFMEDPALTKGVFAPAGTDETAGGAQSLALIIAPLVELQAAGELRATADPAQLADLLWTVVHGIASLRLACPAMPLTPDATLIATAVETILDGSRPRGELVP
jgi:AcrR family transcriptional regulator